MPAEEIYSSGLSDKNNAVEGIANSLFNWLNAPEELLAHYDVLVRDIRLKNSRERFEEAARLAYERYVQENPISTLDM